MEKVKFKNTGAYGSFPAARSVEFMGITPFSVSQYVEWLPHAQSPEGRNTQKEDFFFYFDETLKDGLNIPGKKYGYLFESRPYLDSSRIWGWVVPHILKNIELYKQNYTYIFTCWKDLVDIGAPFAYRISGGSKLKETEKIIYEKSKLVSMFVSNANVLPGHGKRLAYLAKYKHCTDLYGRGHNALSDEDYILAYKDYMFVISFENCEIDYQFSEKLTDPILTGAIPVYCGSKGAVEKYFDTRGILWAEEINPEKDLTIKLYESMKPYIIDNFQAALKLPTIEDYIYLNYLKDIQR